MNQEISEHDEKLHESFLVTSQDSHLPDTLDESILKLESDVTSRVNDQSRDETHSEVELSGNTGWQSGRDLEDRRYMISRILKIIRSRKPRASQETLRRFAKIAKRLEMSIYRSASCLEDYNDLDAMEEMVNKFLRNSIDRSDSRITSSRQKTLREPAPYSVENRNPYNQPQYQQHQERLQHRYQNNYHSPSQHHVQHQTHYPTQHAYHHHVQYQVQPQQQQYKCIPHRGLNGGWQSEKDLDDRQKVIDEIVGLMQQNKPGASEEWLKKLPQMAKRLEEALYRSGISLEDYNNMETLKPRLQQLANNILMSKTKGVQAAVGDMDSAENTDELPSKQGITLYSEKAAKEQKTFE